MPNFPRSTRDRLARLSTAVQLLDVTGPLRVFTANDLVAGAEERPPHALRIVAQGGKAVVASAGVPIATDPLPVGGALDTLIVAGGQGVEAAAADPMLVDWLR